MPKAKLSDAQPVSPQGGQANLSDARPISDSSDSSISSPQNVDIQKKWTRLPPDQREQEWLRMSVDQRDELSKALGTDVVHTDLKVGKSPEWTGFQRTQDVSGDGMNPFNYGLTPESRSWLKQKAWGILQKGQEQLSNIAGPFGAMIGAPVGAAIGTAVTKTPTGAILGARAGEVAGAALAGGAAEGVRQGLEHAEDLDKYNYAWQNDPHERWNSIIRAGMDQGGAQIVGMGLGELLRPTLKKSINNLYAAGMLNFGDPLAKKVTVGAGKRAYESAGQLESVIGDVMKADEVNTKAGKPTTTVEQFYKSIQGLKEEIGNEVSSKMSLPVRQGGAVVPLKDATPNPTPLVQLIQDFETKDPGVVHRASLAGTDPSVVGAKKYQKMVRDRALTFQQTPWTYGLLANERQRINQELAEYYTLTPDGKSAFLKQHPMFEVDKAIAKYIRDITYPEMDRLSGQPIGTTATLQGKYGALNNINDQLVKTMEELATKSRQGATKGMNVGAYATPSGIGAAVHRLPIKFGANDVESQANHKVSRAFGHTIGSKARRAVTSPFGNDVVGASILSSPVRILIGVKDTRPTPKVPVGEDENGPEASVKNPTSPRELMDKAKRLAPSSQGEVAYQHHAVNPATGHRIGSADGRKWYDIKTGEQVA